MCCVARRGCSRIKPSAAIRIQLMLDCVAPLLARCVRAAASARVPNWQGHCARDRILFKLAFRARDLERRQLCRVPRVVDGAIPAGTVVERELDNEVPLVTGPPPAARESNSSRRRSAVRGCSNGHRSKCQSNDWLPLPGSIST